MVQFSEGNLTSGSASITTYGDFFGLCDPYIHTWYPYYYPIYHSEPNKTEAAFKIVSKLMEKGLVKNITLKKFIELVNEISKEVL